MAYYDGIVQIARELDQVLARLGTADAARLRSLLGAFAVSAEEDRDHLVSEIVKLVLPAYRYGDPIYDALNELRFTQVPRTPVAALFSVRLALGLVAADDARERILGTHPMTTATELRSQGVDPDVR